MFLDLFQDDGIGVVAVLEHDKLKGLVITFHNVMARRLYYKLNSSMFVYKGRWFRGEVELDKERVLYMRIDQFGYIMIDEGDAHFKSLDDYHRL